MFGWKEKLSFKKEKKIKIFYTLFFFFNLNLIFFLPFVFSPWKQRENYSPNYTEFYFYIFTYIYIYILWHAWYINISCWWKYLLMVNFKKVLVNALINVYIIYAEEEQAKKLEKKRYLFPPNWGATIRFLTHMMKILLIICGFGKHMAIYNS